MGGPWHGGWLDDGTQALELGFHVYATPAEGRRNVILTPEGSQAEVLDSGGGVVDLSVTGQRVRANLGDAERWIYETIAAVMHAGAGDLGVENYLGGRAKWSDAVCLGAKGKVDATMFCTIDWDFQAPQVQTSPAWVGAPATAAVYPGTATLQDYRVPGILLGAGEGLRFEASRSFPVRPVPRTRGARSVGPTSGALMRLIVTGHIYGAGSYLPALLTQLARSIGPGPVALSGNGNTYADCVLERLTPRATDRRTTSFEATFVQELSSGVAPTP